MAIWEPCNYASNVAYYHTAREICKRESWTLSNDYGRFQTSFNIRIESILTYTLYIVVSAMFENFAQLAQGSAFMHGSNTHVGGVADVKLNDLFAYTVYQAMVTNLEHVNSTLIHELSYTPRSEHETTSS